MNCFQDNTCAAASWAKGSPDCKPEDSKCSSEDKCTLWFGKVETAALTACSGTSKACCHIKDRALVTGDSSPFAAEFTRLAGLEFDSRETAAAKMDEAIKMDPTKPRKSTAMIGNIQCFCDAEEAKDRVNYFLKSGYKKEYTY